jgi:hypothetical protein
MRKFLLFAIILCISAGIHAKGSGGGHASSHASGSHSSGSHSFSHYSMSRPMRVPSSFYGAYGHPPLLLNFNNHDDDCKAPRKCEITNYATRW